MEKEKPNKINQGEQGEQNFGDTPKKATGGTERTGGTGGNEKEDRLPVEKHNNNKSLDSLSSSFSQNIKETPDFNAITEEDLEHGIEI